MNMRYLGAASALAVAVSLGMAGAASAQVASSTLRGTVTDGGQAEAGGSVTAREISTGYVTRGRIAADGGYVIPGLRPGTYEITVTSGDGQSANDVVTLALGQVATLDLDVGGVGLNGATQVDDIIVVGRRLFEVRTPEVATNVSQTQINSLPQISRNFLNFAALAPGVRVTEGDQERTISAGGQGSQAINIFIDGQNQKSTIIDGGAGGQDDSRGNPFPQAAVQEFRVISQNFKAEYEQAGSSIITSVTRSGTNELTGDLFVAYQDAEWTEDDAFGRATGVERLQYGGSIGGPIIRDRLHFFGSYERKEETRRNTVVLSRSAYASLFGAEAGTFDAPFEEDLFFGKLTWSIDDRQRFDLSATYRTEADLRDFGGDRAVSRGVSVLSDVRSINARHQYQGDGFLNEASVDFYEYQYQQQPVNSADYGRTYILFRDNDAGTPGFQYNFGNREATVFQNGGRFDAQNVRQRSLTFKNDLTFTEIEFNGLHTIKMGVKFSAQNYFVEKLFGRNPEFTYDVDGRPEINGSRDIPVSVRIASAVAPADVDNNVIGLYIQDDWQLTDQLEINLGLRWDYEDNAVNNDYVTPQRIRDMLTALGNAPGYDFPSYFNPADYVTTNGRDAYMGMFQPRIGFSYDVFGDESTVIFGGVGRYYDRLPFNFQFDERFKPTQFERTIFFSQTGGMVGGNNTIAWNPVYGTPAGLDPLLAAAPGAGEVFLIRNDVEPPRTDQANLGVRKKFGDFQTEFTLAYGKTENAFAWYIANAGGETGNRFGGPTPCSVGFCDFRNLVFFSDHNGEREFKALYVKVDKPFDTESNWGMTFAYTLSDSERKGGSQFENFGGFDFDYNQASLAPWTPSDQDERHRIVATGIVGLPWDIRLAGILTLGSGLPFDQYACPDAFRPDPSNPDVCWNGGRPDKRGFILPNAWAFRQLDLSLTKEFELFGGQALEARIDAVNVLNFENYNTFEQCLCSNQYGDPRTQYVPTRSIQVGLRYRW